MATGGPHPPIRVFCALSGGGAKGILHVGALRALEEQGAHFCGLAGTSAGAIAATLKAAGFRAAEMAVCATGRTIFGELRLIDPALTDVTRIFGRGGWRLIAAARWLARRYLPWRGNLTAAAAFLLPLIALGLDDYGTRSWAFAALTAWVLLAVGAGVGVYIVLGGLASLDRFADRLDTLLAKRILPDSEPRRPIVMGDFGRDGRPAPTEVDLTAAETPAGPNGASGGNARSPSLSSSLASVGL
jgi:NTE family protein